MPLSVPIRRYLPWAIGFAVFFGAILGWRVVASPESLEILYSRQAYPVIRTGLYAIFGWWPFPAMMLMAPLLVGLWIVLLRRGWGGLSGASAKTTFLLLHTLTAAAAVGGLFLLLWGLNYGRLKVADQLELRITSLSTAELWEELEASAKAVTILRNQLPTQAAADPTSLPLDQSNVALTSAAVRSALETVGFPASGEVRLRELWPGTLLRFGTSGVYSPFTGEAHIDGGLHPLQKPFVAAHEMAHGYGVTDEGTCNFFAWLACTRADNLYIRYAGHLGYFRYVASAVRRRDPEAYLLFRERLSPPVVADLNSINESLDRYKEVAPRARDMMYDSFLKSQGVSAGLASYGTIIDLVYAYRVKRHGGQAIPTAFEAPVR